MAFFLHGKGHDILHAFSWNSNLSISLHFCAVVDIENEGAWKCHKREGELRVSPRWRWGRWKFAFCLKEKEVLCARQKGEGGLVDRQLTPRIFSLAAILSLFPHLLCFTIFFHAAKLFVFLLTLWIVSSLLFFHLLKTKNQCRPSHSSCTV